jgi:hypothetical protein
MLIETCRMELLHEGDYEALVLSCPWGMLYHSLKYRNLLAKFLPNADIHYLLAYQDRRLVGALPIILADGPLGPAANSLPFFGSHGGVLLQPDAGSDVTATLLRAFKNLCVERKVTFATVIETPFLSMTEAYVAELGATYQDGRIGQVTMLPDAGPVSDVESALIGMYHSKTRNMVRKALNVGFSFGHDDSPETRAALQRMHEVNLTSLGGIAKPPSFFQVLAETFSYESDYRVYTARTKSGQIVSALLLLYHAGYVEYFVPAIDIEWRTAQPLSGLIFIAMRDAVIERGARVWNWGGTWTTQGGVYQFKSRWGTTDLPYSYHTCLSADIKRVRAFGRDSLLTSYPWFYTVPFSALAA